MRPHRHAALEHTRDASRLSKRTEVSGVVIEHDRIEDVSGDDREPGSAHRSRQLGAEMLEPGVAGEIRILTVEQHLGRERTASHVTPDPPVGVFDHVADSRR